MIRWLNFLLEIGLPSIITVGSRLYAHWDLEIVAGIYEASVEQMPVCGTMQLMKVTFKSVA